jgi:hypothetical protein
VLSTLASLVAQQEVCFFAFVDAKRTNEANFSDFAPSLPIRSGQRSRSLSIRCAFEARFRGNCIPKYGVEESPGYLAARGALARLAKVESK